MIEILLNIPPSFAFLFLSSKFFRYISINSLLDITSVTSNFIFFDNSTSLILKEVTSSPLSLAGVFLILLISLLILSIINLTTSGSFFIYHRLLYKIN